ncbi:hypothetical protein Q9233_003052 [Columba guinea]|nr:hypothetical protein Q9233_003052 [Columba guinea]
MYLLFSIGSLHPQKDNCATHCATADHAKDHCQCIHKQHLQDLCLQRDQPCHQHRSHTEKNISESQLSACSQNLTKHPVAISCDFHSVLLHLSTNHQPQAYTYNPEAQALFHNNECSKRIPCTRVIHTLHSQNQPTAFACIFPLLNCVLYVAELLTPCTNHQPQVYAYDTKAQALFHNNECSKRIPCTRVIHTLHSQNQPTAFSCIFPLLHCVLYMAELLTPCLLHLGTNHQPQAYTYNPEAQALFHNNECSKRIPCTRVIHTLHSQNQPTAFACIFPLLNCVLYVAELLTPCLLHLGTNHQPQAYTYNPEAQALFHNNECSKRIPCTRVIHTLHSQNQPTAFACIFPLLNCVLYVAELLTPCLLHLGTNHQPQAYTYNPEAQALFHNNECSKRIPCTRVIHTLHSQNQPTAFACIFPLLNCVLYMVELLILCLLHLGTNHQPQAYTYNPEAQALFHNNECSKRIPCTRVVHTLHSQNQPTAFACIFPLLNCVLYVAELLTPCLHHLGTNHQPQAYTYNPEAQALFHNNECSKRIPCTRVVHTLHSQNQPTAFACIFPLLNCVLYMAKLLTPRFSGIGNWVCSAFVMALGTGLSHKAWPADVEESRSLYPQKDNRDTRCCTADHTEDNCHHLHQQHFQDLCLQRAQPCHQHRSHTDKDVSNSQLSTCHQHPAKHLPSVLHLSTNNQAQAYTYYTKAQALFHYNECSKRIPCTRIINNLHSQNQPTAFACIFPLLNCVLYMAELLKPRLHPQKDNRATCCATTDHAEDDSCHLCQQHLQDLCLQRDETH